METDAAVEGLQHHFSTIKELPRCLHNVVWNPNLVLLPKILVIPSVVIVDFTFQRDPGLSNQSPLLTQHPLLLWFSDFYWFLIMTSTPPALPPVLLWIEGQRVSRSSPQLPSHYVVENNPELLIFLFLSSKCLICKCTLLHPVYVVLGIKPRPARLY